MARTRSSLAVLALSLLATPLFAGTPTYHRGSLIHTHSPFVRVGGDEVVFGYQVASGCDEGSLRNAALSLNNHATSDRWDDQWYAFSVPRSRCLVIGWYDRTASKYGWTAIQNMPNTWATRSNYRKTWETMGNGTQKKYSYTINGQRVDLDVFNPENEGALNGDDVLISFGY